MASWPVGYLHNAVEELTLGLHNKQLMTGPKGNSEFCFPETSWLKNREKMCGKSDFLDSLTYSTVAELAKPAAATTKLSYRNITMIVFLSAANKKFFLKN